MLISPRMVQAADESSAWRVLCEILRGDTASQPHDWDRVLGLALDHRVHLLMAARLRSSGAIDRCPVSVRRVLERAAREEALAERVRARELSVVLTAFADADI